MTLNINVDTEMQEGAYKIWEKEIAYGLHLFRQTELNMFSEIHSHQSV
jgi:hypothetical protein